MMNGHLHLLNHVVVYKNPPIIQQNRIPMDLHGHLCSYPLHETQKRTLQIEISIYMYQVCMARQQGPEDIPIVFESFW